MSNLEQTFDRKIAELLGVPPDAVTTEFIHEMRKKMETDQQYPLPDDASAQALNAWHKKCRAWAQEVLANGPSPCR